jgi:hypothetical protein
MSKINVCIVVKAYLNELEAYYRARRERPGD